MLTIHYFASIRESLDKAEERIELTSSITNVEDLIAYLAAGNERLREVFAQNQKILVAVNKTVVSREHVLSANDEIAFFPPMTGG